MKKFRIENIHVCDTFDYEFFNGHGFIMYY